MPTLRIYLDAEFTRRIEMLEEKISENPGNFAQFDRNETIISSGFYFHPENVVFKRINNTHYYINNYIVKESRRVASKNSELAYFKLARKTDDFIEVSYPIFIKLIINTKTHIICFYSKRTLTNDKANEILDNLTKKYGFTFKNDLKNNHLKFRKKELDDFISILNIRDYTEISIYDDEDNRIVVKNQETIKETEKSISILDEAEKGNWSYIKLIKKTLDLEIRLSNEKTLNFITFVNKYKDDTHLTKATNFLLKKIRKTLWNKNSKQTNLKFFAEKIKFQSTFLSLQKR